MTFLLQCLYFMLPAYIANMAPVFAEKLGVLKFLARSVDGGKRWKGRPILGDHKTWRGFVVGVAMAIAVIWVQYFLYSIPVFKDLSLINYSEINLWLLGILLGFGALFGDLIKSFFKRRVGVLPGRPWIPFDQIDFALGALIFVNFIFRPPWTLVFIVLLVTPVLHILANRLGYLLKIRNTKW